MSIYTGTCHHAYRDEGLKERVTSTSCSPLVSLGQSETHSAGGLRKHEDGGRLHSKARASGLQLPPKERASAEGRVTGTQEQWGGNKRGEERGDSNEERGKRRRIRQVNEKKKGGRNGGGWCEF